MIALPGRSAQDRLRKAARSTSRATRPQDADARCPAARHNQVTRRRRRSLPRGSPQPSHATHLPCDASPRRRSSPPRGLPPPSRAARLRDAEAHRPTARHDRVTRSISRAMCLRDTEACRPVARLVPKLAALRLALALHGARAALRPAPHLVWEELKNTRRRGKERWR